MKFNTLEQYVAWRAEWRDIYKAISIDIRETKKAIRQGMRNKAEVWREQWNLITLKEKATTRLLERKKAKLQAIEIWNLTAKEKGAV